MDPSYNALPANIANLLKRTELSIRRFRSEWTRSPSHVFENHVLLIELADMQSSLTALTVAVNRIRSGSDSMPAPSLINVDKLGPAWDYELVPLSSVEMNAGRHRSSRGIERMESSL
jgi:hypothetical protein